MSIESLSKQLETLQEELACLTAAENHTKEQIESILKAISEELKTYENKEYADKENSIKEHLKTITESLSRFETQHPALTDSINRIMITLGNMGI